MAAWLHRDMAIGVPINPSDGQNRANTNIGVDRPDASGQSISLDHPPPTDGSTPGHSSCSRSINSVTRAGIRFWAHEASTGISPPIRISASKRATNYSSVRRHLTS